MGNSNSLTFKFFEKVGYLAGKIVRYTVGAAILGFIGKRVLDSSAPLPTQPPATPP